MVATTGDVSTRNKFRAKSANSTALSRARRATQEALSPTKKKSVHFERFEPSSGKTVQGAAAVEAAEVVGREVVPIGSVLSVYWPGSDESYEATVVAYRAIYEGDEPVSFKHKCEYEMGCFCHDLSEVSYTKIEPEPEPEDEEQALARYNLRPLPAACTGEKEIVLCVRETNAARANVAARPRRSLGITKALKATFRKRGQQPAEARKASSMGTIFYESEAERASAMAALHGASTAEA